MSRFARKTVSDIPKDLNLDSIQFSVFSKEEIRRLCVTKINTPLTFDSFGHPLPGSIYDKSLGPLTERSDPCGTCRLNVYHCPGHFGYIELPLPVVNPLFHRLIGMIFRISCLHCHQIQLANHIKYTVTLQIKLLNCSMVTEAQKVASLLSELTAVYGSLMNIPEHELESVKQYEKEADETLAKLNGKFALNKTTETLRNQFINGMLKEVKPHEKCMFCKKPIDRIQAVRNKVILTTRKGDVTADTSKGRGTESKYINPEESRNLMRKIYAAETELITEIVAVLKTINDDNPTDVFYFDLIPVVPPNVRPCNMIANRISEHPQSHMYKSIIQNTILLRLIIQVVKNDGDVDILPDEAKAVFKFAQGGSAIEKLNNAWEAMQYDVDGLLDSARLRQAGGTAGLKQIIEKKSGIIRMHMMGKRVNYSARSVITPDPNLNVDEIGVPEAFAKKLTYPVPVTPWNVEMLRKMVQNGPDVHPGAVMVEYEDGTIKRINPNDKRQQEGILKRLLTPDDKERDFTGVKKVHRHLCNGDVLLLNRQPTLHKPSIMAHTARILKNEKTFRLHYANCKAYNADFDGDEMNAHFAQNEVARSEAYHIVNVCKQYLVPKDGTPLSGLIQDHIIAGVKLTLRGRFFQRYDYMQLVFQALAHKTGPIKLLPPAIIKPAVLWSGKQVISTIIINVLPEGPVCVNLTSTAKISSKAWQQVAPRKWKAGGAEFKKPITMSEAEVVIRNGELLVGVLDKTHYGATPYGLIHCVYELYGGNYATRLLSAFTKVFTRYLQQIGFTLGVHDILILDKADKKRRKIMKEARQIGRDVVTSVLDLPTDTPVEEIVEKMEEAGITSPQFRSQLDRQYKTSLDSFTNDINRACLPMGLVCKFPANNLQLMVQSGAKGSTVNAMQMSSQLGQIELEGKRPPVMISGKSLPSFPIFEFSPRAGGYIDGRFSTGIQPQELFFHSMAGREGLIDTAVKTSRSGYLQRCLIKHLEGLTVAYDMTVRDSDNCVVQFLYGEDGMDISKVQFLNEKCLDFLADNSRVIVNKDLLKALKDSDQKKLKLHQEDLGNWRKTFGNPLKQQRQSPFSLFSTVVRNKVGNNAITTEQMVKIWQKSSEDVRQPFEEQCSRCPDPANSIYQSDHHFGSLNERLEEIMSESEIFDRKQKRLFENMFKVKAMRSLCAAGEPVGLLAAQSIGEPSTQMTLNTFHFAGRGEMNVTLGIPRLREILMMASKNIKTPSMEVPFLAGTDVEWQAEKLRRTLTRVVVANVLEKIDVTVELMLKPMRQHVYKLRFDFLPRHLYQDEYCVKPKHIIKHMTRKFFAEMFSAIRRVSKIRTHLVAMEDEKKRKRKAKDAEDDDDDGGKEQEPQVNLDDSSDEEPEDADDARTNNKFKDIHDDQEPEEDEKELSDAESDENLDKSTRRNVEDSETVVVDSYNFAQDYKYDKNSHLWCELTFALPMNFKKLDLNVILRDVAAKSVLWETPNIKRAITYMKDDQLTLRTDGINILEMCKYHNLLDLNKLYCNDIHRMAETYGIEAAMKIIVKEVKDVFNVYGIRVDPRHLSLIADYMTFNGTFEPLSRKGMECGASPMQQMSFESSLTFLKNAVISGKQDPLRNPSSCLMVGKPIESGTGSFTLFHKMK